ncbi:MAG: cysteine hydrolase [Roseburia sp.]|nr:cysteine hydrolase [Roseburia sp.]
MKKILVVVDMQKDFIDGALGTKEAVGIVERAAAEIAQFEGTVFVTMDTHHEDYPDTAEGRKLPVAHCIRMTDGWRIHDKIQEALSGKMYQIIEKGTFGSLQLIEEVRKAAAQEDMEIECFGLCTDICVVSNALLLKAAFPETKITIRADCCAGVTPETHEAALKTMEMCQLDVVRPS